MNEIRKLLPLAGSYVGESDFFQPNGSNPTGARTIARLLAVKTGYDPDGLFFVHHGVGSEGWSAERIYAVEWKMTPERRRRPALGARARMSRKVKGFDAGPLADGRARSGAGVRKPPKEETAGRKGRGLVGRELWGFEDRGRLGRVGAGAGGAQSWRRKR